MTKIMTVEEFEKFISDNTKDGKELPYDVVKVVFTPDGARTFLKNHYVKNRKLSLTKVRLLTNAMTADEFDRDIGQTISIGKNGALIDGHHRLMALSKVMIDYEYTFIVVYGANQSPYIDTGKHRTARDNTAMMEKTTQHDMDILNGPIGGALSFYSSIKYKKYGYKNQSMYLADALESIGAICERFNYYIAMSIEENKYIPCDGCLAAILDQFLKGNLDSNEVVRFFTVIGKRMKSKELRTNSKASDNEFNMACSDALNTELKFFGTENIFDGLCTQLRTHAGGGTKQKICFYVTTRTIEHLKNHDDSAAVYTDTIKNKEERRKCVNAMFNILSFKEKCDLVVDNNIIGEEKCFIRETA